MSSLPDLRQYERMFVRGGDLPTSSWLSKAVVLHCPVCLRERGELIQYAERQNHCAVCQCEALEPLEISGCAQTSCAPEEVLADPAASHWLKQALRSALSCDPVDAANDAEVLDELLSMRCRKVLAES
jgi:hypothetical protein